MGRDNPVRFIDAFVDGLDLAAAGFERAAPKATGRPGYDPADLLKLYIYGYLNRVRSSRRLEAESKRNLEVIWLLRRLSPDFKTIADFRRINRAAFRQVFREFVRLCRELELFGRELVAVDGTRIKAVNSRERNFTKAKLEKALAESDERLSRYLDRLDEADGQDEGGTGGGEVEHIQEKIAAIQGRRERFEEHRDALAASGEGQLSLTDPDSRAMHAATRVGVGYNIQIAVDAKHKLIAEQQVHNKVSDLGLLAETAVAARRNLAVDRIDAVADAGYFKIEDIEACENAGVMPHVPKPQRGSTVSQGLFPKERFRYDGGEDIYTLRRVERRRLALDHGVVMSQPRLVQAVDRRDPLDPSLAPVRQSHLAGRALDKIAAHMGPTECKGHLALAKASESLVSTVAVADDNRVEESVAEQLLRRLGAARRVDMERDRITADRGPQPGAARAVFPAKFLHAPCGLVGMAQRRLVLVRKDRLGQRLEQRHEPLQAVGQRPRRDRQPLGGHPRGNAVHGAEAGTVLEQEACPEGWSRRASWGTAAAPGAPTLPWATTRTRRSGASADGGSRACGP